MDGTDAQTQKAPAARKTAEPLIRVNENGNYLVRGPVRLLDGAGRTLRDKGPYTLCRCGHSKGKPYCDDTHLEVGFDGTETCARTTYAERRRTYEGEKMTVFDDRSLCSGAGYCFLDNVFVRDGTKPWIRPDGGDSEAIKDIMRSCPSGALSWAEPGSQEPVEEPSEPVIRIEPNGPYRVRGMVPVQAADGFTYEVRNRVSLCRCGDSSNKPFCDGTHKKIRFQAP